MERLYSNLPTGPARPIADVIRFRRKASTELLCDDPAAGEFLDRLIEHDLHSDAIRFLAYALPVREAIWWGSLCVWDAIRSNPKEQESWAVQAAVQWVLTPNELGRRAAASAARAAGMSTAAGCLAKSVFWSGGSVAKPGLPHVDPRGHSASAAVAGAILLAGAAGQSAAACRANRRRFVHLGLEVACGENTWSGDGKVCCDEVSFVHAIGNVAGATQPMARPTVH